MTSCHGGEATSHRRVSRWTVGENILICWAFLNFSFLETGLGNTVSCLSKKEVLSVAC